MRSQNNPLAPCRWSPNPPLDPGLHSGGGTHRQGCASFVADLVPRQRDVRHLIWLDRRKGLRHGQQQRLN
eukprot:4731305-Prymnesium_polylepis.1